MALGFIFNCKTLSFAPLELSGTGLFGIKMVEAGLARNNLAVFSELQSFTI